MRVAVCGCTHGALNRVYHAIEEAEKREGKVDLLLCCGDFQAIRDRQDLESLACPPKYRSMGDFHEYYNGERVAPVLTIFIGGNHEASRHLHEIPLGGWVAPSIFYMGRSGVISVGPEGAARDRLLRIAGLSGIYKDYDAYRGYYEKPPYNQKSIKSVYHVRAFEVEKLALIKDKVDVVLSHDWPRGVERYGDLDQLLRDKPFFKADIEANALGNPLTVPLLHQLQPEYWFAAHMHVAFPAVIEHGNAEGAEMKTKFLALDKPLRGRHFLHFIDMPDKQPASEGAPMKIQIDPEWLAIQRANLAETPIGFSPPQKDLRVVPPGELDRLTVQKLMESNSPYWLDWSDEIKGTPSVQRKAFLALCGVESDWVEDLQMAGVPKDGFLVERVLQAEVQLPHSQKELEGEELDIEMA